jgi:hypothetical protein
MKLFWGIGWVLAGIYGFNFLLKLFWAVIIVYG